MGESQLSLTCTSSLIPGSRLEFLNKMKGITAVPDKHSQLDPWQLTGVPEQDGGVTAVPDLHSQLDPWQQTGVP